MSGLQIGTLFFIAIEKNEYSLFKSIPADRSFPAVTYLKEQGKK